MVRSNDVSKKPKDPLLTPPSKLRGVGFLDEGGRPSNRGGAAMSPAAASVPNYMRGTSSSDAKGGRRRARLAATAAPASTSPARRRTAAARVVTRGKVLFPEAEPGSGPGLGRATCSSTLKEAKFPDALHLAPGATDANGPAAMLVCPYTYCSLNGHAHAPAVPLRSFLASRRRLIKTQQSMKLKGVSAFRKKSRDKNGGGGDVAAAAKMAPLIDEETLGDFFVEVYAGPRVSSDMSCSDVSLDEMDATVRKMEFVVFDRCGADENIEKGKDPVVCGYGERDGMLEEKHGAYRDSSSVCSDAVISGDFIEELPWMRYHGYEYDSLDDGIPEEQRVSGDEIDRAQISEEQEGNGDEGASDRPDDEGKMKAVEEHVPNGEENISNLVLESEIAGEQEGVASRVEPCQELDRRDEDSILDALCHGEPSAGQATVEEKLSDPVDESEIHDQEVAGRVYSSILEESCNEETSADQQAEDAESSVKSDGGSKLTPDDGSEMEISEDTISSGECREDFSEEVTSKSVLAEDVFEQHDSIEDETLVNDAFEQDDSPENAKSHAQKELGITSEIENESKGSDIVYSSVDSMKEAQKEIEVVTCEESGTATESNPDTMSCLDDSSQMELKITTFMPKDEPVVSALTQGRSLDGDAECVADGAMGPEITRCKLEDAYKEAGIDQEAVEDDESVRVKDDAQNDYPRMTECKFGNASKDPFTTQDAEESDNSANVSSEAQNESNCTTSELALGISEDTENESNVTTCHPEDVSEESGTSQESDHDGCSSYIMDGTQNGSDFTFESEGAQEDSGVVKEDEGKCNCADSQKLENTACESGGASERPAMSQEADRHVNIIDSSDRGQKDIAVPKLDASEDIQNAEESNQLFNAEIPEPKYDCTAEGHTEPQSIAAEVTDAQGTSIDDICDAFNQMNLKGDVYFDPEDSTSCPRNKLIISRRRRIPEEEEYMRGFNPRAPNFLPVELDPDAEKVDLRHQMVDERKNAEEWMIDYALRRAVTNLAPARKKKVELLVQAFETVLPHDEDEKKSMTPPRPVQACN